MGKHEGGAPAALVDTLVDAERTSGEKQFLRFSRLNRTLHVIMIVSFMSLALTGMTLKFSYAGWAQTIAQLFGGPLLVPCQRLRGGEPLVVLLQDGLHGGAHAASRAQRRQSVQIGTCTK